MKKIIALIITAAIGMALCACGTQTKSGDDTTAPESESTGAGIVNPMVEASADEIKEKIGVEFKIPEKASGPDYYIVAGEMAQADFSLDGNLYTLRAKKSDILDDISGMYYEWDINEVCDINGNGGEIHIVNNENEKASSVIWYDPAAGMTYSVSVNNAVSRQALIDFAQAAV